jgi:hypothetical protein
MDSERLRETAHHVKNEGQALLRGPAAGFVLVVHLVGLGVIVFGV